MPHLHKASGSQLPSEELNPRQPDSGIAYTRLSPSQEPGGKDSPYSTIIFLHGGESCHLEFSRVAPFLADDYEILLVDLPGHSRSRAIPFRFDNAISALIRLVKTQVKGGKAHIVGLSLGGFVGLKFARQCPNLVLSLWCTGCAPFSRYRRWFRSYSRLMSAIIALAGQLAAKRVFWAPLGVKPIPGLKTEVQRNQTITVQRSVLDAIISVTLKDLTEIQGVRISIIAGGKQDNVEDSESRERAQKRKFGVQCIRGEKGDSLVVFAIARDIR